MKHWDKGLLAIAIICILFGAVCLVGYVHAGKIVVPALVQMFGLAAICLYGSWRFRKKP